MSDGRSSRSDSRWPRRIAPAAAATLLIAVAVLALRGPQSLRPDWVFPSEMLLSCEDGQWTVHDRTTLAPLGLHVERVLPGGTIVTMAEPWRFRAANAVAEFTGAQPAWNGMDYFGHGDKAVIDGRTFRVLVNGEELGRRLEAAIADAERNLEEARKRGAFRGNR